MTSRCHNCGVSFEPQTNIKYCPLCEPVMRIIQENKRKEAERRRKAKKNTIDKTLKELERYNKKHKTNLSYGKFITMKIIGDKKK